MKLEIKIEKLIEIIVREVIVELLKIGVTVDFNSEQKTNACPCNNIIKNVQQELIDFSGYRTPVLTENHLLLLNPGTVEIVIPKKTIVTPGAKEIIKKRKLIVSHNS